jgi:hypothetical protein
MALIMQTAQNRETWLEEMTKKYVIPHFTECGFEYLEYSTVPIKFSVSFIEESERIIHTTFQRAENNTF